MFISKGHTTNKALRSNSTLFYKLDRKYKFYKIIPDILFKPKWHIFVTPNNSNNQQIKLHE